MLPILCHDGLRDSALLLKRVFFMHKVFGIALLTTVIALPVYAQTTITPRAGGGYNTYDYGTGNSGTVTPRPGGGYNIHE